MLGNKLGDTLGDPLGDLVGAFVVGEFVGETGVGVCSTGELEGESLGLDVGDFDGDVVDEFDGTSDGAELFVGPSLGAELGK